MHWLYLYAAILFELSGTSCMKLSEGFQKPLPSIGIFIFYISSVLCLTLAVKVVDISIAYAIWSGVGIAVIATIGILFFGEPFTLRRFLFLTLIVVGVVGLNLSSGR
ncbi:DMT family transporter [Aromatoleum aromaticum]|nr:multidrug efflux SMR transporter [Aromatoleum aromaticum]